MHFCNYMKFEMFALPTCNFIAIDAGYYCQASLLSMSFEPAISILNVVNLRKSGYAPQHFTTTSFNVCKHV